MSISSEISRLSGNVSDALDAISDKGVTVPSGSNSDDLATLISAIPIGTDVSNTTATASDVLSGKYFYTAAGVRTQGSITSRSDSGTTTLNASTTSKSYSAGYYASAHGCAVEVYDGTVITS